MHLKLVNLPLNALNEVNGEKVNLMTKYTCRDIDPSIIGPIFVYRWKNVTRQQPIPRLHIQLTLMKVHCRLACTWHVYDHRLHFGCVKNVVGAIEWIRPVSVTMQYERSICLRQPSHTVLSPAHRKVVVVGGGW